MATSTQPAATADSPHGYLEWGPVLGGAALAGAITFVLVQFASGVGLASAEPLLEDGSASWSVLVAGLFVVLISLASSTAGGYVAGRLRARAGDGTDSESEFRDGVHGLVVWAVATLAVGIGATLGTALAGIATAVGTEAASAAANGQGPSEAEMIIAANVSTIFTFATAAGAALGAAAAWFAAVSGGEHRNAGTSISVMVPKMFRRTA